MMSAPFSLRYSRYSLPARLPCALRVGLKLGLALGSWEIPAMTRLHPVFVGSLIAICSVSAAELETFAPAALQLEAPPTSLWNARDFSRHGVHLDLPMGPVRIDYGTPIPPTDIENRGLNQPHQIDAPGPGYLKQIPSVQRLHLRA